MLSSDLLTHFGHLEDPRVINHNTRHKFIDILILGFIGHLCGCDDWVEVEDFCNIKKSFFEKILELPNGIPSHDTFGRVFSMIDTVHFEEIFIAWMNEIFIKTKGEIIAVDGKTIRGSRTTGNLKGIHLVNAWACENQLTIGVMKVDDKSNEITAIPKLLKMLNIKNCTVTIDAMGCQRKIAKEIIKNKANYVLHVKDNQKDLKCDIAAVFSMIETRKNVECWDSGDITEKGHGREEVRRYLCLPASDFLILSGRWEGLKSLIKVIRKRKVKGELSVETLYFISSHPYHSEVIPKAIRSHWHVENRLHWQLDVSFHEDHCRARIKNEAQSIALLRRISMTYLKKDKKSKVGIKCKRKKAGWDDSYLLAILRQDSELTGCEK